MISFFAFLFSFIVPKSKTFIQNNEFSPILNKGIILNNLKLTNQIFENKTQDFSEKNTMNIIGSIFKNITNNEKEAYGGAFNFQNKKGKIIISNCGFDSCFSSFSSGAFYIQSKKATLNNSCITFCSAKNESVCFTFDSPLSNGNKLKTDGVIISHTGIDRTGPLKNFETEQSMYLFTKTKLNMTNANITKSQQIYADGTLACEDMGFVRVKYSNFEMNGGPGLVSFYNSQENSVVFGNTNFLNNSAGNFSALLAFNSESGVVVEFCNIFNNTFYEFVNSQDSKDIVLINCSFDCHKKSLKRDKSVVSFKKCSYMANKTQENQIEVLNYSMCLCDPLEMIINESVNEEPTEVEPEPVFEPTLIPSASFTASAPFTATRNFSPSTLNFQCMFIYVVVFTSVPLILFAHKIKRRLRR